MLSKGLMKPTRFSVTQSLTSPHLAGILTWRFTAHLGRARPTGRWVVRVHLRLPCPLLLQATSVVEEKQESLLRYELIAELLKRRAQQPV